MPERSPRSRASSDESLGTVARAIQVLRALAESADEVSVTDLADDLGLPRTTSHRILQLLREHGMVQWNPSTRRYSAGSEFYRLAALVLKRRSINDVALPVMQRVVEICREDCLLGLLLPADLKMTFVEQVASPHPLRFTIPLNAPLPLEWGCSGRVILAYMEEAEIDAVLKNAVPSPVTGKRLPAAKRYKAQLAEVRTRGYDRTAGEKVPDSRGIAAPIFRAGGGIVGSLALTIPAVRYDGLDEEWVTRLLVDAAAELSRNLGHLSVASADVA